ncbi:MAG: transcription antitermination factor NusB [Bacteroidetes bacterium]|nr:transcription antitermination factor NusB [Bacteroidota bacterium]
MLSRRHLRIRVMQALYAFYQSEQKDIRRSELELLNGTEKIFELYLTILQFFNELAYQEYMYYEDMPASMVTGKRKTAASTLKSIGFLQWIEENKQLTDEVKKRKISWQNDIDIVKKAFFHLRQQDAYQEFIVSDTHTAEQESKFLKWLFKELFSTTDFISHLLEEKNIYWAESLDLVESMVVKTYESAKGASSFQLLPLFKDQEDDTKFMQELIQKTIRDDAYFQQLIADKTKNWDADRIALVDIILMKMALCEILNLSTIPVKVSINEYIDISKDYSTPNSKSFINGVIDKLVIELKTQGKIQKTGRGLVE